MSWNNRVMRYSTGEVGVHEVYYDKRGKVDVWTKDAIIVGDTVEELLEILEIIRGDIIRYKDDILDYGGGNA